jgi:hypothetical protein
MVTWRAARAKADSVSVAGWPNSPRTATDVDERGLLVHAVAVPEQYQRPPLDRALGQPQNRGHVLASTRHGERHYPHARVVPWF